MSGSILQEFGKQVANGADRTALICDGRTLSYGELDRRANQFARVLQRHGARPADRIAVSLDRSLDTFVVLLGVLKVGCVYVPLDPTVPVLRRQAIAEDARTPMLVAAREDFLLPAFKGHSIALPDVEPELAGMRGESPDEVADAGADEDVCCVLFTSGTTGSPKGVVVPGIAILNHARWMWTAYPFRPGDLALIHRSCTYMAATWDYFGPLLGGAPALVVPGHTPSDPAVLLRLSIEHGVTHVSGSPGFWRAILDRPAPQLDAWTTLRLGAASGEGMPSRIVADWRRAFPRATLLNVYGITEAVRPAVYDTRGLTAVDTRVPIGAPLPGVAMYVLDEDARPVAQGSVGEIVVGGVCVARGYHDRRELTRGRFVPDPSGGSAPAFRTGDLGRQRADGDFEIVGRVDHQVKVHGYRVELEEVEAALHLFSPVRRAVVSASDDARGETCLIAYVVPEDGAHPVWSDFRTFLDARLPDYMIPARFVLVPELPLTPSGKPDRLALASLAIPEPSHAADDEAASNLTEAMLAQIWSDVIGVSAVHRGDTFLELGGHSLMAMEIASQVDVAFGVELPLESFFQNPRLDVMAAAIDALRRDATETR